MTVRTMTRPTASAAGSPEDRVQALDWDRITADLASQGSAVVEKLLAPDECRAIASLYPQDDRFRSKVVMGRHGFGRGEYKYFAYPLPALIEGLRTALYPRLAPIANHWNELMGIDVRYPAGHAEFLERCHAAGQTRPTPLLLQYGEGDYNCLHQDLYGDLAFPIQVAILSVRARPGPHWRRVRADRAAPAHAVATGGPAAAPGRCSRVRGPSPPGQWCERPLQGQPAPRRQPREVRAPAHARHHFSRRQVREA